MKTIAKFLYGGHISIFGALARLLSDQGTSFTSSIIEELCKILGVQWLWTMPCHPQTNRLVEGSHQMIMCMIGKVGKDKKANWPTHLAEIAHAYNSTQSAVTGYSPHYLMLGRWPRLPVNFVFPTIGSNEAPMREASARSVDVYVASVRDRLRSALKEVQAPSTAEAHWQKQYYDRKIGTVNLKPGNLVLVKADAWKGKREIRDRWEEETWKMVWQIVADIPLLWSDEPTWMVISPPPKLASSCCIRGWHSLVYGQPSYMGQVYQSHPMQDYLYARWWWEDATWENGKAVTWRPTSKASLGWKKWEVAAWIVDIYWSIHWGWVKTTGKVIWLQTLEGTCT